MKRKIAVFLAVGLILLLLKIAVSEAQSTAPSITVGGYTNGQVIRGHTVPAELLWMVWKYFPEHEHTWAVRVAMCESGGNLHARSPGNHLGWWQHDSRYIEGRIQSAGIELIHNIHPLYAFIHSPHIQAQVSAHLLVTGGKGHWQCK